MSLGFHMDHGALKRHHSKIVANSLENGDGLIEAVENFLDREGNRAGAPASLAGAAPSKYNSDHELALADKPPVENKNAPKPTQEQRHLQAQLSGPTPPTM
ncbi:MAG TPA: hypothetical protein VFR09_01555 [Alphaproteobacteria bacterium]|nr:hypothetical protein [Alphaproteobacteria bacterium]